MGQNKARRTRGGGGDCPLPFGHVAIYAARHPGFYPGEPRAGRRSCDERRAFSLAAARTVCFRDWIRASHDLMARRARISIGSRASARKQRALALTVMRGLRPTKALVSWTAPARRQMIEMRAEVAVGGPRHRLEPCLVDWAAVWLLNR